MIVPRPSVAARLHELRFTRFLNLTKDIPKVKGECAWCGGPSNMKYCSGACESEAYMRAGASVTRSVFSRDHGVCIGCGMDTRDGIGGEMSVVKLSLGGLYAKSMDECPLDRHDWAHRRIWGRITRYPKWIRDQWGPWWMIHNTLWEADHIVPVVDGGGCCGLDNYQTLCIRCHKADTKALAGRIAGRKRARKRATGPQQELGL